MIRALDPRATGRVAIALLVAACSSPAVPSPSGSARPVEPSPSLEQRYVAGGQGGGGVQWLTVVPCTHRPSGWPDARVSCNFDKLEAIVVDVAVYAAKSQGDPYP